jgi:hypothetical protein
MKIRPTYPGWDNAMKVLVRDREAFAALSHLDLRAYLHARGWREEGRLGDKALILVR